MLGQIIHLEQDTVVKNGHERTLKAGWYIEDTDAPELPIGPFDSYEEAQDWKTEHLIAEY